MNILLTGSTGFLGSHLLEGLLNEGHGVSILKRSTSNPWRISHLMDKVKTFDVDITPVERAFEESKIDVIIHTACNYGRSSQSVYEVVESNLMFGLRVMDAAIKYNAKLFINTDTLLPKNINYYSLSKKQFVEWLKKYSSQIQVINFRLDHMYGPKDDKNKFVFWLIDQFKRNVESVKLTAGEQIREFIHINDVVSAYLYMIKKTSMLNVFNEFDIGTGMPIRLRDFVERLHVAYTEIHGACNTQLEFGAMPYRDNEMMTVEIDTSKLAAYGWHARSNLTEMINNLILTFNGVS